MARREDELKGGGGEGHAARSRAARRTGRRRRAHIGQRRVDRDDAAASRATNETRARRRRARGRRGASVLNPTVCWRIGHPWPCTVLGNDAATDVEIATPPRTQPDQAIRWFSPDPS